jgi:glucosamine kinase
MSSEEGIYVGVDGGGTGTKLVCMDENLQILSKYQGPGTNWNYVGKTKVKATLLASLRQLLKDAGKSPSQVTRICLSIAGVHTAEDEHTYLQWIAPVFENAGIFVCNDVLGALASGTGGNLQGAVCIAGTGMNCYGKYKGAEASAGGMGPFLGDVGSGFYIGEQVLIAAARANDGRGKETTLLAALLKKFEWKSFNDAIHWRYEVAQSADVAALAFLAFEHAEEGDAVAKEILSRSADGLSECIVTVVRKLWRKGDEALVVTAGSVWKNKNYRDLVNQKVQESLANEIKVALKSPDVEASFGAALIAKQMTDLKPPELVFENSVRKISNVVKGLVLVGGLAVTALSMKTYWKSK